mgnify:CR=1 FL=1
MLAAYPPARGCDAQLDAFCADTCEHSPSFARLDDDFYKGGIGQSWRCYSLQTLSADRQIYMGGTEYCSRDGELRGILAREGCVYSLPTTEGMMRADGLAALLAYISSHSTGHAPRIAVIGSSGNLLHRGRGSEIDSHDIVMRVNGPVLDGYEDDVGSRVCCRLSNPHEAGPWGYSPVMSRLAALHLLTQSSWDRDLPPQLDVWGLRFTQSPYLLCGWPLPSALLSSLLSRALCAAQVRVGWDIGLEYVQQAGRFTEDELIICAKPRLA